MTPAETGELIQELATPVLTFLGLVLGYLFSLRKTKSETDKITSDSVKVMAEAEKIKAEADALVLKNDAETIQYYVGIIQSLRTEVSLHNYQIQELNEKIRTTEQEKDALRKENEKLTVIVSEQGQRIAEQAAQILFLQSEIDKLNGVSNG